MSLGELKGLRARAGYEPEDVAQRVFRSSDEDSLKRLEDFEEGRSRPTLKVLRSLLAAYQVPPRGQEEYLQSYRVAMRLKERAAEKGLTLKHVADKVGVDRTNLSKFFNGSRLIRKPRTLLDIAAALEIDEREQRELLREAGFEALHLVLGGQDYCGLAAKLLQELRRGVGTDRHPKAEGFDRTEVGAEVEFMGAEAIVAAASRLVLASLSRSGPPGAAIRISIASLSMTFDEAAHELAKALRIAVERGASVQLLLPLDEKPESIVGIIVGCLQYLGQEGGFDVRWFDPAETAPPPTLMILPDDSVLLSLPDSIRGRPERAVLLQRPRQPMESFIRHFDRRFQSARPLLKLYDSSLAGTDDLVRGLTEAEKDSDAVLVVKRRVTPHTMPEDLWELEERHLRSQRIADNVLIKPNDPQRYELFSIGRMRSEDREAIQQSLKAENRRRLERHLRNLEHGTVREIYLKEYLEEFLRYGSKIYPPEARIAIIDHLLDWLKRYPRYRIGFATQGDLVETPLFGVHNSETVFLSVWQRKGGAQYLEVRQPVVARIFQQYFLQLWSDLPSSDKSGGGGENEKDGVVGWLEELKKEITESEAGRG